MRASDRRCKIPSIYIFNKMADITPPCLISFDTEHDIDINDHHWTCMLLFVKKIKHIITGHTLLLDSRLSSLLINIIDYQT